MMTRCKWCGLDFWGDERERLRHRLCWVKAHRDGQPVYLFLSGPYASDPVATVRETLRQAERLIAAGYHVYVPHLCHLWDLVSPHDPTYWLRMDIAWLGRCDALVRLPGRSPGADIEAHVARADWLPVATVEEALDGHAAA